MHYFYERHDEQPVEQPIHVKLVMERYVEIGQLRMQVELYKIKMLLVQERQILAERQVRHGGIQAMQSLEPRVEYVVAGH